MILVRILSSTRRDPDDKGLTDKRILRKCNDDVFTFSVLSSSTYVIKGTRKVKITDRGTGHTSLTLSNK